MEIEPGDVYQVMVRRGEGARARSEPLDGHLMTVVAIDGERVVYRRDGGAPGETTRAILAAAIRRGDFEKVSDP